MATAALLEELVEEIFLRLPPEEPACLLRAAMVCKAWCRILSDGGFRRRYCQFHRTRPALLGYVVRNTYLPRGPEFVPTTAFSPRNNNNKLLPAGTSLVLDCRHGRMLIYTESHPADFIVWDPVTGDQQHLLSFPAYPHLDQCSFHGAFLCAMDGCDHLHCGHAGPFLVVLVGTHTAVGEDDEFDGVRYAWASVYSSETGAWSSHTSFTANNFRCKVDATKASLLIGDALYFTLDALREIKILKYDLRRHRLSMIDDIPRVTYKAVPIDIDGGLGLIQLSHRNCIFMWSRRRRQAAAADDDDDDANGVGEWVQHHVVDLEASIPTRRFSAYRHHELDDIRFAEGTDTVFISLRNNIDVGVFALDLNSRQVRKVNGRPDYDILPYMGFYTPDLAKGKLSPGKDAVIHPPL